MTRVCPRCSEPMEHRFRKKVTQEECEKKGYLSQWYVCKNGGCKTTTVTFREDWVDPTRKPKKAPSSECHLAAVNPQFRAYEGPPMRLRFIGEFMRAYRAGELQ